MTGKERKCRWNDKEEKKKIDETLERRNEGEKKNKRREIDKSR